MTRSLRPLSLLRGLYYYVASALAAFYLVFVHTLTREVLRTVRWIAGTHQPPQTPRSPQQREQDKQEQRARQAQQEIYERAAAELGLAPYEHSSPALSPAPPSPQPDDAPWSLAACPRARRTLVTRDGVRLTYHILFPNNVGPGRKLMVFASGLGFAADFIAFTSLVHRYGREGGDYAFLTWEYRGLFSSGGAPGASNASGSGSSAKQVPRRLAIPNHAEDLAEILEHEGSWPRIDVLVGYSLGVAIALEFAALYPERLNRLALINGTYGNAFETAFQPMFRIPFLSSAISAGLEFVLDHPAVLPYIITLLRPVLWAWTKLYNFVLESDFNRAMLGPRYIERFLEQYLGDVLLTPEHTDAYLRLFQEINAHSAYHLLRHIKAPTLVISGLLDPLTPAYCGFEMARRLPNSRHVVAYFSSHCALLEQPALVIRELSKLIEQDAGHPQDSKASAGSNSSDADRPNSTSPFTRAARVSAAASHARRAAAARFPVNGSTSHPAAGRRFLGDELGASAAESRPRGRSDGADLLAAEHSVARTASAYYPHDSDDDAAFLDADAEEDRTQLRFDDHVQTDERERAQSKQEDEKEEGSEVAASATVQHSVSTADAAVQEPPVSYSAVVAAPASLPASFDPSLPAPVFASRPVAVLTCSDQWERKHDDRSLIAALVRAGVPAEHVQWDAPPRPWSHYRAVIVRSVWGYWRRPTQWQATLDAIAATGVPVGNSLEIIRWNSHKQYLQAMEEKRKALMKQRGKELKKAEQQENHSAASANGAADASADDDFVEPMGFIPTLWLHQSDLDAAALSKAMTLRGWGRQGGVLKPTSSAGGYNTIRLPSPVEQPLQFAAAVEEARVLRLGEQEREEQLAAARAAGAADPAALPCWMLQPFQPQILTDGEFSFFFLLAPGADGAGPSLRFVHGGQKRPKAGSFLVQPTQGGILTPWVPTARQVSCALATLRTLTPFPDPGAFLYVRVDCIRAWDSAADGPAADGALLLMEVEAVEPDFYSHLTPEFPQLYFEAAKAFLQREAVWEHEEPQAVAQAAEGKEVAASAAAEAETAAAAAAPDSGELQANGSARKGKKLRAGK